MFRWSSGVVVGLIGAVLMAPATMAQSWVLDHFFPDGSVWGIAADSHDNIWMVGFFDDEPPYPNQLIHFDGKSWNKRPLPAEQIGGEPLFHFTLEMLPCGQPLVGGVFEDADGVWRMYVARMCEGEYFDIYIYDGEYAGYGPVDAKILFDDCIWVSLLSSDVILHWNGREWTEQPLDPEIGSVMIVGIEATGPDEAWVVGMEEIENDDEPWLPDVRPIVLEWDGVTWSRMGEDFFDGFRGDLYDIVARNPSDIWAVGVFYLPFQPQKPLFVHWDGVQWTQTLFPNISYGFANGLVLTESGDIWAQQHGSNAVYKHDGESWSIFCGPDELNEFVCPPADCYENRWLRRIRAMTTFGENEVLSAGTALMNTYDGFLVSNGVFIERLNPGIAAPTPDLNGDGVINSHDLVIVLALFGSQEAAGDANHDGVVDSLDLACLLAAWQW